MVRFFTITFNSNTLTASNNYWRSLVFLLGGGFALAEGGKVSGMSRMLGNYCIKLKQLFKNNVFILLKAKAFRVFKISHFWFYYSWFAWFARHWQNSPVTWLLLTLSYPYSPKWPSQSERYLATHFSRMVLNVLFYIQASYVIDVSCRSQLLFCVPHAGKLWIFKTLKLYHKLKNLKLKRNSYSRCTQNIF